MSAAEKLKALDAGRPDFDWPDSDIVFALLNSLPQIVAVVEAAEWLSDSGVYSYERHEAMTAALAALDEALT